MFSDNILKLINNSIYITISLILQNAFLMLPLTSSCMEILFDVTDYTNLIFIIVVILFFFFSCTSTVKTAAPGGNNYI